jgi:hypothetical protein
MHHKLLFADFPSSLMRIGKASNDGTIPIFTKDSITIHPEHEILITCHSEPILIGVCNEFG